jgi:biotin synthase-like enzyme
MLTLLHDLRHDWTIQEIEDIYTAPLSDLVFRAAEVHRACHRHDEVQGCSASRLAAALRIALTVHNRHAMTLRLAARI